MAEPNVVIQVISMPFLASFLTKYFNQLSWPITREISRYFVIEFNNMSPDQLEFKLIVLALMRGWINCVVLVSFLNCIFIIQELCKSINLFYLQV
jgi:N-acyl-L-homoserine lactone synthetase